MLEVYKKYKTQFDKIFFILIIVFAIYIFLIYILSYVAPFVVAFIFSLMLEPLVSFLNKHLKFGRSVSALICIGFILFFISSIGIYIIYNLLKEAVSFISIFPSYLTQAADTFERIEKSFTQLLNFLPPEIQNTIENCIPNILNYLAASISGLFTASSVNVVTFVPGFIVGTVLCIVSTFFFIKDKLLIRSYLNKNLPRSFLNKYVALKQRLLSVLVGYVKAQLTIMGVICAINIFGLLLISYPYALFIGIIIGIVDCLPIFGSGMILLPWAFFCFIGNDYFMTFYVLALYGINFITRQIMEPKIIGDRIGLYSLAMLISIYIGLKVFGVLGFFIGPLILITLNVLFKEDGVI